ncbi:MAG: MBL fold metallo-hydrolase [Prevotella sp.]|nr:MBL fold metallo-hydrolase [Prevotella sp.]
MINIKRFCVNVLQENCYVVSDETKECVIIDCGAFDENERNAITEYISQEGLLPKHLLCTHGHLDHNFGIDTIFKAYGLWPEVQAGDERLLCDIKQQAIDYFAMTLDNDFPAPVHLLEENEIITYGTHKLQCIHTPGHTQGSMTFYDEQESVAFTGDTLFRLSIGRTDLPGGSMFMMINSLRLLSQLPDDTKVYSGHGEPTSIGYELSKNPYMER